MELCLVRHGPAEERGLRWPDDRLRPLSAEGREKMALAARGLARLFTPEVIFTSGLVRADQTAGLIAAACGAPPVIQCSALANEDDDALLAAARASGATRIAAVGHEPSISATLSWLLTGDAAAAPAVFRKGTAALVRGGATAGPGAFLLEWLLQPAALRLVAG